MRSDEMLATIESPARIADSTTARSRTLQFLAQANEANGSGPKQQQPAAHDQEHVPTTIIPFHGSSPSLRTALRSDIVQLPATRITPPARQCRCHHNRVQLLSAPAGLND